MDTNRILISKIIEKMEFVSCHAKNGEIALAECKREFFDIVFMDIQMPIIDGFQAIDLIRNTDNLNSQTPIIVTTGSTSEYTWDYYKAIGFSDLIQKPISSKKIKEIVEKHIKNDKDKIYLSESMNGSIDKTCNIRENSILKMMDELCLERIEAEELMDGFVRDLPRRLLELRNSIESGDIEKINAIAHGIKGLSASLRMEDISLAFLELENASKIQRTNQFIEIFGKIEGLAKTIIQS